MKKILFLIILLTYSINTFAEVKLFKLNVTIDEQMSFKYAYLFDNNFNLIKKINIESKKFEIEGTFNTQQRFGQIPLIELLFSDKDGSIDAILSDRPLSRRRFYHCTIICEAEMEVTYNSASKLFSIQGNEQNLLQNKFHQLDVKFITQRDSSNSIIDKLSISENEKFILKETKARSIFNNILGEMVTLIRNNLDSEISLFNFGPILFDQEFTASKTEELFEDFSDRVKSLESWIHVTKDVNDKLSKEGMISSTEYTVGMNFPKFILPNSQGIKFNSSNISGKFTLIDFWATWCIPCRKETPNIVQAQEVFKDRGFKVITISIDAGKDKNKWLDVLKQDGMIDFVNLFNGGDISGLAAKLKVIAIPANYLVDESGKIVAVNLRGEELQNKLKELMP